jgi:hypothetical protein
MTAHTPGPWKVDAEGKDRYIVAQHETGEYTFALLRHGFGMSGSKQELEANARLIAAAPSLLAALEDLLDLGRAGFIQGADIAVTRAVEEARAAVAAARGSSKEIEK